MADEGRRLLPGLGVPAIERGQHGFELVIGEGVGIERFVRPGLVRIGGHVEQLAHPRSHWRLPAARPLPQLLRPGGAHQPLVQGAGILAESEPGQAVEDRNILAPLGFLDHVGQHRARQQFGAAIIEHPRPRREAGFLGEIADQILREGVDGIDPEAAAGAVEHAREQAARAFLRGRTDIRAEIAQLLRQHRRGQPHPARQHRVDTVRHLRRARLGEGQAQDL